MTVASPASPPPAVILLSGGLDSTVLLHRLAAEPVVLAPARDFNSQTSYALQAAERELDSLLDVLEIEPGGLRVTTTLDRGWQHRLEQEL
mgnify:CR=1 FL=1